MSPNLLLLGGTLEATALAQFLAQTDIRATVSLAGRVARPKRAALPQRVGGFGGVAGLEAYLRENAITHVVDATHPFAAQMSHNAVAACAQAGVPLIALTREPWVPQSDDRWVRVADIAEAVAALDRPAARVMLAVGRMHLAAFAPNPQHHYLLRLIDAPDAPLPFPHHEIVLDRGPFTEEGDRLLMARHGTQIVVSKNSGGTGAYAKIAAARARGSQVIMIDRPAMPERLEAHTMQEVMNWLSHSGTDLGV
ncbi:cobalt-precorrin-6A reductase [Primorskyibacter sp. S187A]|uniref:cobalt-precorrin-6A reductase n=1 Tax=Primorskyibacter sp. S187A TaxID=3415130 RepID=UPI003C7B670E